MTGRRARPVALGLAGGRPPRGRPDTGRVRATEGVILAHSSGLTPDAADTRTLHATTLPVWLSLQDHGDGTAALSGTPANEHVGPGSVVLVVTDAAGLTATQSFAVAVANVNDPPTISGTPPTSAEEGIPYLFLPAADDVDPGDVLTFVVDGAPAWLSLDPSTGALSGTPTAAHVGTAGPITVTVRDLVGAMASLPAFTVTVSASLPVVPPDPATVAPPLSATVATAFGAAVAFLYSGADPIQAGVAPGTISDERASVLRGRVLDEAGTPLPGARVTILGHPEALDALEVGIDAIEKHQDAIGSIGCHGNADGTITCTTN